MMRLCQLALVSLMFFLVGCASTVKFDPTVKSKLTDGITINPTVQLAEKPYYHGPENTWGMMFGPMGAAVAAAAVDDPTKIKNYLAAEKIDVRAIVLDEFKHQLNQHADFAGKIRDDGKYRLDLSILIYGLSQKNGFSSEYKPILNVKAKMIDPMGKVVWEDYDYTSPANSDTLTFTYKDYFNNPETFRAAFASAAKVVVTLLLKDLK